MPVWFWIIISIVALAAIFYTVCYFFVRKILLIFIRTAKPGSLGLDYGEEFKKMQKKAAEWHEKNPHETVTIKASDGLKLSGYWWDRGEDTTILFIHGYGNTGVQATFVAEGFMEALHVNILAPDCRAHGGSEGRWIGFGWPDRLDVLQWIDYLINLKGKDHKILLFGISMGASTVLSAAGEELPANVRAVCADCGYCSLSELFIYILKNSMHLPRQPVMFITNRLFKKWFGYPVYAVDPLAQVKKAKIPILFIHGDIDQFIPSYMCKKLYDACPSQKEILIVPDAKHALSAVIGWDQYIQTIQSFCCKYTAEK